MNNGRGNHIWGRRLEWLAWVIQKSYFHPGHQKFNTSRRTDLIDSFLDTDGAIRPLNEPGQGYRTVYEEMGLTK